MPPGEFNACVGLPTPNPPAPATALSVALGALGLRSLGFFAGLLSPAVASSAWGVPHSRLGLGLGLGFGLGLGLGLGLGREDLVRARVWVRVRDWVRVQARVGLGSRRPFW